MRAGDGFGRSRSRRIQAKAALAGQAVAFVDFLSRIVAELKSPVGSLAVRRWDAGCRAKRKRRLRSPRGVGPSSIVACSPLGASRPSSRRPVSAANGRSVALPLARTRPTSQVRALPFSASFRLRVLPVAAVSRLDAVLWAGLRLVTRANYTYVLGPARALLGGTRLGTSSSACRTALGASLASLAAGRGSSRLVLRASLAIGTGTARAPGAPMLAGNGPGAATARGP